MDRLHALAAHLRTLSPAHVARLLRRLPPGVVESADEPAHLLPGLGSVVMRPAVFENLTQAQYDLLAAAVDVAEPEPAPRPSPSAHPSSALLAFGPDEAVSVDTDEVLARVGATRGAPRAAATEALDGLLDLALLWPGATGRHHLAQGVSEAFGGGHRPPGVNRALSNAYDLTELRRIALALGLNPTGKRRAVQAEVVALLTDPDRVESLMASAPPGAVETAERLAFEGAVLGTYCFVGGGRHGEEKFRFRPEGSGDPDTDWLAEHGLLVPVAPERAVLPNEVRAALRARGAMPFSSLPPVPAGVPAPRDVVAAEAQAALIELLGAVDRLVAEIAARPAALRRSGGMTVRDRKRLTKALGTGEDRARLWIELAHAAGLLVRVDHRVTVAERVGEWTGAEAAERIAPLLPVWLDLPDLPTWWPEGEDPVIPGEVAVTGATAVRQGLLSAMADLPEGQGIGTTARELFAGSAAGDLAALEGVVATALWHRPWAQSAEQPGPLLSHSLYEAELLGLVAHGSLTRLGRAVVANCGDEELHTALSGLLPRVEHTARFQGDMTALVPGTPSSRLEGLLDSVADRETNGHARSWRLSAASVLRALDNGQTADSLLKDLVSVSSDAALPQTVEYLVRDTARSHGRMRVLPAGCCVRSDDTALVRELAGHRGLRSLRLRAVADTVLISAEPVEATLDALRRQGYAPVLEDEAGDVVIGRARSTPAVRSQGPHGGFSVLDAARSLTGRP